MRSNKWVCVSVVVRIGELSGTVWVSCGFEKKRRQKKQITTIARERKERKRMHKQRAEDVVSLFVLFDLDLGGRFWQHQYPESMACTSKVDVSRTHDYAYPLFGRTPSPALIQALHTQGLDTWSCGGECERQSWRRAFFAFCFYVPLRGQPALRPPSAYSAWHTPQGNACHSHREGAHLL